MQKNTKQLNADKQDWQAEAIKCMNRCKALENYLELKDDDQYDFQKIDFGTGEIIVGIKKGSALAIADLVDSIKSKAMVTPVYTIANAINRLK